MAESIARRRRVQQIVFLMRPEVILEIFEDISRCLELSGQCDMKVPDGVLMTKTDAIRGFGALGQETRFEILRLLAQRGPEGMAAGELGARLKLSSAMLSFHLSHLKYAGLVTSERQSNHVIYTTKCRTIAALTAYLSENCGGVGPAANERAGSRTVAERHRNVLFLCTRNSARSIMAECALNRWGGAKFRAFSAGSDPRGAVHPATLAVLKSLRYETDALRSKNWNEFSAPGGPKLDFVFTLCDRAAAEACPAWPGQPIRAHWGIADPVVSPGSEPARRRTFAKVYKELERRIRIFAALPIETLERFALERWVTELGKLDLAA